MAYEHNNGRGSMFRQEMSTNPSGPNFRGTFKTPEGVVYEISAWSKEMGGKEGYTLAITVPYAIRQQQGQNIKPAHSIVTDPNKIDTTIENIIENKSNYIDNNNDLPF